MTRPNTSRKFPMNLGGIFYDFVCIGSNCLHGFRAVHVREGAGSPPQKENAKGFSLGPAACVSVDIRCLVFAVLSCVTHCKQSMMIILWLVIYFQDPIFVLCPCPQGSPEFLVGGVTVCCLHRQHNKL
jgi:hypothetical protein